MLPLNQGSDDMAGSSGSYASSLSPAGWCDMNFNISDGVGWFWDPAWNDPATTN
jgi:hypothetical protein